jgi:hypothetical protein
MAELEDVEEVVIKDIDLVIQDVVVAVIMIGS